MQSLGDEGMMFEKESEEWFEKLKQAKVPYTYENVNKQLHKAFKDGAEVGYQEGLKAKINATTISDCPVKDEWHYPSKGEYPTTEEEVLVYLWDSFYIGTYCLDSSEINRWHFNDFDEKSDQITAWLYIEPPKIMETF